ncbi:MAG: hypothetical protein ACTSQJ_13405, partial [Promethearchaeota archaeon]
SKLIENLILNHKENESNKFLQNHIIKPMKNGIFKQYTDRLSEYFGPEECAIKIYDSLNKKVKKSYPFTEISFIREIQKIIEEYYPDKVKLFTGKKK